MGLFSSVTKGIGNVAGSLWKAGNSFLGTNLGKSALDLAGAAGTGFGSYLASKEGAKQKRDWDRQAASKAYHRGVRSFKNRYQWQMEDMRRAGLNPILAYRQGPPGGPQGVAIPSTDPTPGAAALSQSVSSARGQLSKSSVEREQVRNIRAATEESKSRTAVNQQQWHESIARQGKLFQEIDQLKQMIKIAKENYKVSRANSAKAVTDEQFYKENPWARELEKYLRTFGIKADLGPISTGGGTSQ